jgi:putative ABC transport system permease protein
VADAQDGQRLEQIGFLESGASHRLEGLPAFWRSSSENAVFQLWQDVRYGARTLAKSPAFVTAAILTLALGIGANAAIFSVVNSVLLKPMPFPDPDRLVIFMTVWTQGLGEGSSPTKFHLWREHTDTFQDVSAYRFGVANLTGGPNPEQIPSAQVSADFFRLFGATVALGRTFAPDEDQPNGPKVAVLSDGFWKRRFGGDPEAIGKTISLTDGPYEVIEILGPSFNREKFDPLPDVWLPFQLDENSTDQAHYFLVAGRLKPGVTMLRGDAQAQLAADEFRHRYPGSISLGPKEGFTLRSIQEVTVGDIRPSLLILIGAVSFVLLIACANVASLLLVRATGRKREIAVRSALGCSRGRMIRQLLTESLLLSLAGGALGLAIGTVGIHALLSVSSGRIPRIGQDGSLVNLDWHVVAFTILVSLVTGVLFGLIPAFQASRSDLSITLKEAGGRAGTGFRQNKARAVLVISELALAVVLLVGSALLIRTFVALRTVKPGFDARNVLTMRMSLAGSRFEKTAADDLLIRDGVQRISALPRVLAAASTCCVPLEGGYGLPFIIVGRPLDGPSSGDCGFLTISAGYFNTFKIPVLRGRSFTDHDDGAGTSVAIINQAMAQKFWPSGDPLKDRLIIGKGVGPEFENDPPRQIVGVVGDVRDGGLNRDPRPTVYIPWAQSLDAMNALNVRLSPMAWVVRTSVEPHSLSAAIQNELRQASGGLPVADIRSMDEIIVRSTARQDFNMLLMTIFAASALLLAAVGIYGLIAYSVQQRTQEIGIRLALGAEARDVRTMVIVQGMRLALAGVVIGLLAAFWCARLIASSLFGVKVWDPAAFITVPLVLSAAALIASWLPAVRASRVDPVVALRYE